MEFTIALHGRPAALAGIDEALRAVDPAAVVDLDASVLRVAGVFDVPALRAALRRAGHDVAATDITTLPSVCCGGCSG